MPALKSITVWEFEVGHRVRHALAPVDASEIGMVIFRQTTEDQDGQTRLYGVRWFDGGNVSGEILSHRAIELVAAEPSDR